MAVICQVEHNVVGEADKSFIAFNQIIINGVQLWGYPSVLEGRLPGPTLYRGPLARRWNTFCTQNDSPGVNHDTLEFILDQDSQQKSVR